MASDIGQKLPKERGSWRYCDIQKRRKRKRRRNVEHAQAHLKFYGKDSKEIKNGLSGVCWLDEENHSTFDLLPGGPSGHLLVLILTREGKFRAVAKKTEQTEWGPQPVDDPIEFGDIPPSTIEISLLDENRRKVFAKVVSISYLEGALKAETEHLKQYPERQRP